MKITNLLEASIASMPEPGQVSFRSGRSETSLEEMTAGSVASVPMPMGKMIKRESGITKGIKKSVVDEASINEDDLSEEQLQAKKRREELFQRSKPRDIGNKPNDRGIMAKEEFNGGGEYNDEIDMVQNNLHTIVRVSTHLGKELQSNENMPEWVQEKIAVAKAMMVTVLDYMKSQHERGNVYTQDMDEAKSASERMQKALQREKEKREYSERYAEKNFPIGKKPEPIKEPVKEGEQDWMKDVIAMAHKMAPQDKMRERQAQRDAQSQSERQQRIQQDIENLPDLISQYNDMEAEYESMGGKNWQYADREQNLSDEERKARGMETSMRQLADRIHTAKKASEGLAESKPDFAKMFDKKIGKHNTAVVKTKKEIGTRVADIGPGGKEYNVKTDKEWDKQKGVAEMNVGKRKPKPDSYHINKDGKPVSLASYDDKDSAVKDRDEKHPGAEVHQVGSRGKVKGKFEEGALEEEKPGLWANIHAKQNRIKNGSGEHMRKPGSKGAPTADALRKSAK